MMNNIPEHLMAQAETRQLGKREVKVIPVSGKGYKEVMVLFSCPKSTALKTVKRGYYVVDYCKKTVTPGWFDPDDAYRMAWWVFNNKFRNRLPEWADHDDMVQEGVIRLIELAGHPRINVPGFAWLVIKSGMLGYLRQGRRHDRDGEKDGAVSEGCQHCAPSPNTWHCKHAATEAMCRVIEAKGMAPMDLAA